MPGLSDSVEHRVRKRKRNGNATVSTPAMKAPQSGESTGKVEVDVLESQILQSRQYYNNLVTLINYVRHRDRNTTQAPLAIVALCRVFSRLMASGVMKDSGHQTESGIIITHWLLERFREYRELLVESLADGHYVEQKACLELLMQLSKEEVAGLDIDREPLGHKGAFLLVLRALSTANTSNQLRGSFVENYVQKFDDMLVHTFRQITYVEQAHVLVMYLIILQQYACRE